jgi:hypothetical protein
MECVTYWICHAPMSCYSIEKKLLPVVKIQKSVMLNYSAISNLQDFFFHKSLNFSQSKLKKGKIDK